MNSFQRFSTAATFQPLDGIYVAYTFGPFTPQNCPEDGRNGGSPAGHGSSFRLDRGRSADHYLTTNLGLLRLSADRIARLPKRSDRRVYTFIHELSSSIMTPSGLLTNRRLMSASAQGERSAQGLSTERQLLAVQRSLERSLEIAHCLVRRARSQGAPSSGDTLAVHLFTTRIPL